MLVSSVFLLRGIYSLISGRCSLRGFRVKGKQGRIAGLILVGQFIVGTAIWATLYTVNEWGSSSSGYSERITAGITELIIFSLAVLVGYMVARAIAKEATAANQGLPTTHEQTNSDDISVQGVGTINCPFCSHVLEGYGRCSNCGNTVDQWVMKSKS